MKNYKGPKVLIFDIETAPILGYVWDLWDQNIALNQIKSDWHILSWSAKWLGDRPSKIMYEDQRNVANIEDDSKLLKKIWSLLNEADVVITQNGRRFDQKKLNARFIINKMKPPSSYKHIDTLLLAKKHFAFSSNKLEYVTDKLCIKYKKLKHKEFPGFEMWSECIAGNIKAWKAMEKYNKYDVLALEEYYTKIIPWDSSINFNLYSDDINNVCKCGNEEIYKNGYCYTSYGRYQRYSCKKCGAEVRGRENLLSRNKKRSIKLSTTR